MLVKRGRRNITINEFIEDRLTRFRRVPGTNIVFETHPERKGFGFHWPILGGADFQTIEFKKAFRGYPNKSKEKKGKQPPILK